MSATAVPVLTYHGYNVAGNEYHANDHVALAADLDWLAGQGWTVIPLAAAIAGLFDEARQVLPDRCVAITFDDGTDLDWLDVEFADLGRQRSLAGILDDARRRHPQWPAPSATAFVIASPDARRALAAGALQPGHAMNDAWWAEAERSGLLSIGNHSWDHRHPLVVAESAGGGSFFSVEDEPEAVRQIVDAGQFIADRTGQWPPLFAYPWGQASAYLRYEFFPAQAARHRCRAAFGTEPGPVHAGCDRWYLPRYVCGDHWRAPEELAALLA